MKLRKKIKKKYRLLLEGASGKVGDMILCQFHGNTYARKAPGSYNKIPTPKQAVIRQRFIEAHRFAQSVINDPLLKVLYEKKAAGRCSAYIKAVSEYLMHLPG
jgi:hypothetical protein